MAYRDNTTEIGMVRRTERFEVVWPDEFEAVRVSEERADDIAELFFHAQAPLYNQPEGGTYEQCRYDVWRYFSHHRPNPWWPTFLDAGTMVYDRAGGKLVGVCLCAGSQTEGHIFNIFVAPAFRRRGLATRMLHRALTVFDTFNLVVDLNCESEEGRKTYESVGFVALDEDCRSRANQRLLSAAAKGMIDDVKALLAGPDVDARSHINETPLMFAASGGHLDVVKHLIAKGADVNAQYDTGNTPLIVASWYGHLDVVRFLIAGGADIHIGNNSNETALEWAACHGHLEIAKLLVDRGAVVDAINTRGGTPLVQACENGRLDVARYLVDQGANLEIRAERDGFTPLMAAACNGHVDVVEFLLPRGANPNVQDTNGKTALSAAKDSGHGEVVDLLVAHGGRE